MRKNVLLRVNYPNGRKWMLTVEKKGKRTHTRWDENGNIALRVEDYLTTGESKLLTFYPNGEVCTFEMYDKNGDLVFSREYNEDGAKVER